MGRRSSLRCWWPLSSPMRLRAWGALLLGVLNATATSAWAQVNPACYPWRTTVSALPFGDPGIFGYSAEEVCRALIARSGNPQLVNGGTVRVFKTFTGKTGAPDEGGYCGVDRQAFSVATGEPVPSESGPYFLDGVGRQLCQPSNGRACSISNPADPALGIKTEMQVDYAGAGAHPLSLIRSYRSAALTPSNLAAASVWRHNFGMALELRSHHGLGVGSLVARRADGSGLAFSQVADNTWRAISTTRDVLSERRDAAGTLVGYSYAVSADNSIETYDAAGRLTAITARNGWLTTLTYDAADRLSSVRNHFGRELRFTHDAAGRLAELLPPGALSGAGAGTAASPIRYHYEDNRWPQALTGITDEAGVRWATYGYDAYGRVASSEHVGGTDRFSFAYEGGIGDVNRTTVTDHTGATPRTLVYTFADVAGTRYPSGVSAPCNLCGSTQQVSVYNAQGDHTRTIAHDGTVTFYGYNARGQETERATFPASFNAATTRPALANATKVVSTKWHGTFNLPTQVAEPGKFTANTYNAKGMLTGQSWTATTDATGAAKFNAVKTGSTYATGWGYNANSLNTSIVMRETAQGSTTAVERQRHTLAYAASGSLTSITDVTAGNLVGRATSYDAHGRLLQGTTIFGDAVSFAYSPRGYATSQIDSGRTTAFVQSPVGYTREIRMPDGTVATFEIDSARRLVAVRLDGTLISGRGIRDGALPHRYVARLLEQIELGVLAVMPTAFAQAAPAPGLPLPPPVPGVLQIGQPQTTPEDVLTGQASVGGSSRFTDRDRAMRRLLEGIVAMCMCEPSGGYDSPRLTPKAHAHISATGHLRNVFGNKSYFIGPISQAMVDEIAHNANVVVTPAGGGQTRYFVADMGRDIGLTRMRDPADPNGPPIFVPTRSVTMFVSNDNCDSLIRKRNEVVTMYPGV